MIISAGELLLKLKLLDHQGIRIPNYEQVIWMLEEFMRTMSDEKRDLDFWCDRLVELDAFRDEIGMGSAHDG
jgi:hypothetical protein